METTIITINHQSFEVDYEFDSRNESAEIVKVYADKRVNGNLEKIDITPEAFALFGGWSEFEDQIAEEEMRRPTPEYNRDGRDC